MLAKISQKAKQKREAGKSEVGELIFINQYEYYKFWENPSFRPL